MARRFRHPQRPLHRCRRCDISWEQSYRADPRCPQCGCDPTRRIATAVVPCLATTDPSRPAELIVVLQGDGGVAIGAHPSRLASPKPCTVTSRAGGRVTLANRFGSTYTVADIALTDLIARDLAPVP